MFILNYSFSQRGQIKFDSHNITEANFRELLADKSFKEDFNNITNLSIILPASDVEISNDVPSESFLSTVETKINSYVSLLNKVTNSDVKLFGKVDWNIVSRDSNNDITKYAFRVSKNPRVTLESIDNLLSSIAQAFSVEA